MFLKSLEVCLGFYFCCRDPLCFDPGGWQRGRAISWLIALM